jgi:flagellar biosynthesis/type III secretory pathway M-ring protein FliF/YscJ
MIANIIYFLVFIILAFVLSIAVKAITRGVEAKQIIKEEKDTKLNVENEDQNQNSEVVHQIKELKNLHDKGILNDDEFKKAKEKILK